MEESLKKYDLFNDLDEVNEKIWMSKQRKTSGDLKVEWLEEKIKSEVKKYF